MKLLHVGLRDPAGREDGPVARWQYFLRGQSNASRLLVDGDFGAITERETKRWQSTHGLKADGVVGSLTYGAAAREGFRIVDEPYELPPKPSFRAMTEIVRMRTFGRFDYEAAPTPRNAEHVRIDAKWVAKNIVTVEMPILRRKIQCHRKAEEPLRRFLQKVDDAGLADRIVSFNGCWVPRFKRGSRTRLSPHAWGTALDLNAAYNKRGVIPAPKGAKGSLIELVPIGHECGLYWGGHYRTEDGMHFEVAQL